MLVIVDADLNCIAVDEITSKEMTCEGVLNALLDDGALKVERHRPGRNLLRPAVGGIFAEEHFEVSAVNRRRRLPSCTSTILSSC